jgi:hypothetical protein
VITNESAQAELDAIIQATVARGPVLGRGGESETILSSLEIAEMQALQATGLSLRKLAKMFGVSHRTVGRMLS